MEKRILIAFLLSFAVLYGSRFLFPPPPPPNKEVPKVETPVVPPPVITPQPNATPGDTIQAETEKEETVDTPRFRAVVSNVGGVLKSFQLKEFKDAAGKPTELIDSYAGRQVGFPLAINTSDPALNKLLSDARFVSTTENTRVNLEYRSDGVVARKSIDFDPQKYEARVSTELVRNGTVVPHDVVLQGEISDQSVPDDPAKRSGIYQAAGKFHRLNLAGIDEPVEVVGSFAGVEDQYFLAMLVRDKESAIKVSKQDYQLADLADGTKGAAARGLSVSVPSTEPMTLYIGPKQEDSLVAVDARLGGAPNYGWYLFAVIAKPLLVTLRWIDGYIGNYGWSIIVLTILINMVLFPLRVKQQLAMQKMQKMAPQLKQLQEKYKKLKAGDPKRAEVEKELMAINKQQLSGCLPLLLQMPLLFAFLNMITAAVELRGAPWILWIKDLSVEDPLFILPILMGVAMFVQMKMSPTSPDPAQARMMMITPVLVTILFLWYRSASGLTLYWLTGNVISIGQQWFIKKFWADDDVRPARGQPSPA
ncbi:MAG TPA: membrane protein insertase YidC [Terriglobia bacterium]|nr:membrane protein insertase YidC [Terriglobia bacterium]